MIMFFKLLELFLLKLLFNKDEYKFNSKNFNPIKVFTIVILFFAAIFNIYLIIKVNNFYNEVIAKCPQFK